MLSVVLSGLVMVKFANNVANFYAFNCLGAESVVLRNKRCELVSKKSEFAEIGMKAALAAATYPKFDRFCDGTIEAEDIARAFANVEGVPWETAFMIARNILCDADTEPALPGEVKGLNFIEFMTCLEGDAINFEQYLKDTRDQFDQYMLEDEAEDAAAGKAPAKKAGELTLKQKLKREKEEAARKAKAREEKMEEAEQKTRADAEAAGKDYEQYVKDKIEEEDDAMRERCRKAFEEELARIEKDRPEGAKKPKPDAVPSEAKPEKGDEEAATNYGAVPGAKLELSDELKQERLGKTGVLTVHLKSAKKLAAADANGLADPYCVAQLSKKSAKSKAIAKTLTPEWNQDLTIKTTLSLKTITSTPLVLTVKDKDGPAGLFDDAMGKLSASLEALADSATIEFVEKLDTAGEVAFGVTWVEGTESPKKKGKKEEKADDAAKTEDADTAAKDKGEGQDKSEKEADKGVDGAAAETAAAEGSPASPEKKKKKKKPKDGDEAAADGEKSEKKKKKTPRASAELEGETTQSL